MAFKSLKQFTEERTGNFFLLRSDGDSAEVVFLYRNADDALTASTHYIKSAEYNGYVHCNGIGCPACGKNIRVQEKLFIPMFVRSINGEPVNEIRFWDRNTRFIQTLTDKVFTPTPDPVNYVYRITRKGQANDINTTYDICPIDRNRIPYDTILQSKGVSMPDHYETVCKDLSSKEMTQYLNNNVAPSMGSDSSYTPIPRKSHFEDEAEPVSTPAVAFNGVKSESEPVLPEDNLAGIDSDDDEDGPIF